jgi:ubiquinone/menaquinone biosynthesis C-methylase UbiE
MTGRALVSAFKGLHPYHHVYLGNSKYSFFDLLDLDKRYKRMHEAHYDVHNGIIKHLGKRGYRDVLEVGCGTGWNIPLFRDVGLDYYGLDISETAIAVAMLKYPEYRYFNLSIADGFMLKNNVVDVVYSSSMLEHIGFHEEAIDEMVRMARNEVYCSVT